MPIPRDGSPDSTLALLSKGYLFISDRCRRLDSDAFETRLMLRGAICMQGEEAARVFYVPGRFTRRGALPLSTLLLLQDKGSVAMLDGEAHRRRKGMFMSLMTPEGLDALVAAAEAEWRARFAAWEDGRPVTLLDEAREVMCRAACRWTGVPLTDAEAPQRTRELVAMIDGAGSVGPRNWRGMLLRARTERWARGIVEEVRSGALSPPPGSGLGVIASHRDEAGALLDPEIAAVEIINLLRPTVAVARFIAFAALALHQHPNWRGRLAEGDDALLEGFVQEVRRFYPFFPLVAGRVVQEFDWRGRHFRQGEWVLLDLYGTDHDARSWPDPDAFRPGRFREREITPFNLIPQGGGDFLAGHRCPGEWATIALMKNAVALLTRAIRYEVPEQDLGFSLSRMPTAPRSGFVLTRVERIG